MVKPFILGIEGLALTDRERGLFREAPPFGIILFLRNVDNPDQLAALVDDIKTISDGNTLMVIDQEGGRVQRLAPPYWSQFPIAGDFDALEDDEYDRAIYALYRLIGDELAQASMDINCAPCLDLRSEITAPFLQDRSFSARKSRVISAGRACVNALKAAGIAPVMKHLPGHGRSTVDSHLELPRVVFEYNPYEKTPDDVEIFKQDYGVDMAMNAHILYPQIDKNYPLTLSPQGIEFIREVVGFKGLLMSDDLAMKALKGKQGDLARRAFDAGLDVAMSCEGKIEDIEEIYSLDITPNPIVGEVHARVMDMIYNRPARLSDDERTALRADMKTGQSKV